MLRNNNTMENIEKIKEKAEYCLNCKIKPCSNKGCPLGNNIPGFIKAIKEEDYKKAIKFGVRKINYYSYMAREGVYAAREICQKDITFYHEIATFATERMKKDVLRAMNIFYDFSD